MQESLITFETAKLAKEKGFNILVDNVYAEDIFQNRWLEKNRYDKNYVSGIYPAPTQSLLQKWLREVHNIDIYIEPVAEGYGFYIHKNGDYIHNEESCGISRNTYEGILEVGLQEALKLIK